MMSNAIKTKKIPSFRHRDISVPLAPEMPIIPALPVSPEFQWVQKVLFPGIQLAVFGSGLYLLFTVVFSQASFNMGYLIGFMVLGMISSLICAVIEYFISKRKQKKRFVELQTEFIKSLKRNSDISYKLGSDYCERLNNAFPSKIPINWDFLESRLWERTYDENLLIRIGTEKGRINPAAIAYKQDYSTHLLSKEISEELDKCAMLSAVPYMLECTKYHCLTVTGKYAVDFIQALICDLVANYSPEYVQIHCRAEKGNATFKELARLPHITNASLVDCLNQLSLADDKKFHLFWISGFLPVTMEVMKLASTSKAKTLVLIQNPKEAPAFSDCCIEVNSDKEAEITIQFNPTIIIEPELIKTPDFNQIVTCISTHFTDEESIDNNLQLAKAIPDKLTLYDFLEIKEAEEWSFNQNQVSDKGLLLPIGIGIDGKKVVLNFTACRGHGILAGMTGSGKSQFLLSMIVILSLKYQLEFFTFAIIDFKADASAMQLRELPNFVGALSDLDDESQLNRALVMLDCESKRRQKVLNAAKKEGLISVNEIEYYHSAQRSGKSMEPLPYLLVIVDEFVDAKRSDPNFLEKMARIARQGRSRGIYLLLAAQNPSSEIGGQIAANVGYNICFKVRDDSISTAVIGKPIASDIDARQRGRGYLLTDFDGLVEFQTPYCGEELMVDSKKTTQLEELVQLLNARNHKSPPRVFVEPLRSEIIPTREILSSLSSSSNCPDITIPVGYADNIYNAKIDPINIPFSNGNVMVFGNPGSGKTNLVQSLLFMGCSIYSPDRLQFVVCAFGDSSLVPYKNLPHVRSVISFEDSELLSRLPSQLEREVNKRKVTGSKQPSLIVIIDRMESLVQEYPEIAEQLTILGQISFKYGVFFFFSSIRHNILSSDKRQSIKTWIAFQTDNDPYSYYMPLRDVKKPAPMPGRSLTFVSGSYTVETQFFTLDRFGTNTDESEKELRSKIKAISDYYGQPRFAFDIETIPEPISSNNFHDCDSSVLPLGLRWDSFEPDGYLFSVSPFFVVSGYHHTEEILIHMAIYAAKTDNFKTTNVYYCDPNTRNFSQELLDCTKVKCFGENLIKDFFEQIRPLYTSAPVNDVSGNIFIFINHLSLCESKTQTSSDMKTHYDTFVKEVREQSSQLLGKKIHFIFSEYAGLLQMNRSVSSVMIAANQYGHGAIYGGTTYNRIGTETLNRSKQIPDGCAYLYRPGDLPTLIKLQNQC